MPSFLRRTFRNSSRPDPTDPPRRFGQWAGQAPHLAPGGFPAAGCSPTCLVSKVSPGIQWKYFVLPAPRQTRKTSALLALRDELNAGDEFRCVYVNVEGGQSAREDVGAGVRAILSALARGPQAGGNRETQKVVIECKVLCRGLERTLREGLEQTRAYMDRYGAAEGHLVVFDRTEGRSWDEKIFRRDEAEGGAPVTVWGM